MEREKVIEIFLGLLLIVILFGLVLFFTGFGEQTTTTTEISHSYNVNSYNTYSPQPQYVKTQPQYLTYSSKPYIVADDYHSYSGRVYYVDNDLRYAKPHDGYLRYNDWSDHRTVKSILGTDIDRYEVYVRNRDYVGGYFDVNFYLDDYYGRSDSYKVTHYIKPHEEKRFLFKDVSTYDYKYGRWRYEVVPQTKSPSRVYYNTEGRYAPVYSRGTPTRTYFYYN
jgi:hypothetical protein